jgi:hypothetical protein
MMACLPAYLLLLIGFLLGGGEADARVKGLAAAERDLKRIDVPAGG